MIHQLIKGSFFGSLLSLSEIVEFGCKRRNIFPSFENVDATQDCLLVFRELDVQESTYLVVEVDTVDEAQSVEVTTFDAEEVTLEKFLVTSVEVLTDTWILVLNLALDTSIFEDVQERLDTVATIFDGIVPTFSGSVESVTNFVTDKQVVEVSGHFLPDREDQRTVTKVERCGCNLLMLNADILGSKELSENGLFRVRNGHHKTSSSIYIPFYLKMR